MAKITDITLLQQPIQHALVIKRQGSMATFSQLIAEGFQQIDAYLKELDEQPSDIPCIEYPDYNEMTEEKIDMVITFYTPELLPSKGEIQSMTIPGRKVLVCLHKGSYEELGKLYNEMAEWIKGNGFKATGSSIEHYYTHPEIPETEHITRVVMPLK